MKAKWVAALMVTTAMFMAPAVTANAAPSRAQLPGAALNWAESHAYGHPYIWGGAGPYGFDCSGTVVAAYSHLGVSLPHNTVAMVHSGKLYRVYSPRRGDLAFWGSPYSPYHVEFVTRWYHVTFGAANSRIGIGWHSWKYNPPSSFWRIR